MSLALLATARRLASAGPGKPRQSDLKRAVSTAYYALFHEIARNGADLLVGVGTSRSAPAWKQTYRALDHGAAKRACTQLLALGFSPRLCACGDAFIELQEARQDADYDPDARITRAEGSAAISLADRAIGDLRACGRQERKAFAIHVLLRRR